MKSLVHSVALITALAAAAHPVAAQAAEGRSGLHSGIQISAIHSLNLPGGGWGWAEAATTLGLRVAVPLGPGPNVWAGAARAEIHNVVCEVGEGLDCGATGTPWLVQAGAGYRFGIRGADRLVPYAGAGISLERWTGGREELSPHVYAGIDWFVLPSLSLRAELQSELQTPGRVAAGISVVLP